MYRHRVGVDSLGGRQPGSTPEYVYEASLGFPINQKAGLVLSGRTTQRAWAQPFYEPRYVQHGVDVKLNLRPRQNFFTNLQFGLSRGRGRYPDQPYGDPEEIDPIYKYILDDMTIANTSQLLLSARAGYVFPKTVVEVRTSYVKHKVLYDETPPFDDPIPDRYRLALPGRVGGEDIVDTVDVYWQGDARVGYVVDEIYLYRRYLLDSPDHDLGATSRGHVSRRDVLLVYVEPSSRYEYGRRNDHEPGDAGAPH